MQRYIITTSRPASSKMKMLKLVEVNNASEISNSPTQMILDTLIQDTKLQNEIKSQPVILQLYKSQQVILHIEYMQGGE